MKTKLLFALIILFGFHPFGSTNLGAQNIWTAKTNSPGAARHAAVSFVIGTKAYVGTGTDDVILYSTYETLYLCSAMVLQEYRRKGIAKKLTLEAIEKIRKDHPIKSLFVWAFAKEGDLGSERIAQLTSLPLYKRSE